MFKCSWKVNNRLCNGRFHCDKSLHIEGTQKVYVFNYLLFLGSSLLNTHCSNFWKKYNHSNIYIIRLSKCNYTKWRLYSKHYTCSQCNMYHVQDGFKKYIHKSILKAFCLIFEQVSALPNIYFLLLLAHSFLGIILFKHLEQWKSEKLLLCYSLMDWVAHLSQVLH